MRWGPTRRRGRSWKAHCRRRAITACMCCWSGRRRGCGTTWRAIRERGGWESRSFTPAKSSPWKTRWTRFAASAIHRSALDCAWCAKGALPGVDRPALAAAFPTVLNTAAVLLDVGANVDCTANNLAQFAVMGDIYCRSIFGMKHPRVGLLSIGEEEGKGNDLTREAFQLLKRLPINFIGNVEGRDLYNGHVDVIVADGFVGNVALKTSEGVARLVRAVLKDTLKSTITRQVGAYLSRNAFSDFKKRLDHTEYGGAPLLGIKGVCIITHGSSNVNAIKNAVRVAAEFAEGKVNETIERELAGLSAAVAT